MMEFSWEKLIFSKGERKEIGNDTENTKEDNTNFSLISQKLGIIQCDRLALFPYSRVQKLNFHM